ncbi:MAG: hypothetical protein ACE5JG_00285 [Planctomycetota bacterium]
MDGERGITLLESVLALLLFVMMGMLLLNSQGDAAEAALDAEIARDIAFLLPFRLNLIALDPDDYQEDSEVGEFPAQGHSSRLVDEEEVFGDRFRGYTWRMEREEVVAGGAEGTVQVADAGVRELLFPEEGGYAGDGEEAAAAPAEPEDGDYDEVDADSVDLMLFIRVTVYPPGFDPNRSVTAEEGGGIGPRSAWTAVLIPKEEEEEEGP